MDNSNLEIKPINFILNGLKNSSSAYAKATESETASVFNELQTTMKKNGNSISAQDFYKFFGNKYQINNGNFAAATNILASIDGDDKEISFKDFGLYQASYEVLMSLSSIDTNNITQQQVTNIANILNSSGTNGKTLNQVYNEIVSALGLSNNSTYDDIKNALLTSTQRFFRNKPDMNSKIYAVNFTNLGKAAFEDFINSNGAQKSQSSSNTATDSAAAQPAQQQPIEVNVQGWVVDNNKNKITTQYNETLSPTEVNRKNIIMGAESNGYGVYYDMPNSSMPNHKGKPLGYYTQDKNGNTVFFKLDDNSQRRLPEGYTRNGNDIYDQNGNKVYEYSIYDGSRRITDKGYRLEQGDYNRTNRKIFDNQGNLIGYVKELEDGYTSCYFYTKPIAIEPETTKQTTTATPQKTDTPVVSQETEALSQDTTPTAETPQETEETESSSQQAEIIMETPQETETAATEEAEIHAYYNPNVKGWELNNSTGEITTQYNETLVLASDVNAANVILSDYSSASGYGVYYSKPNKYSPNTKGKPLGYYTKDENGKITYFSFKDETAQRLPEGFKRVNDKIIDENGNKAKESSLYEIASNNKYKLEQGNYDKSNRKVYDKEGNIVGVIAYSDDGYVSCLLYESPLSPALEEFKDEIVDENGEVAEDLTAQKLSDTINNIFAREDISAQDKLKLVREIKNKYGDSLKGKLDYDAKEFYYFISEFMANDLDANNFNADNLIEMIETYQFLTGCDFSTLGKDLKKQNKDRLNKFLYGMFNSINLSNNAQAQKLNEYFDFVGLIQSNFSGKDETEMLGYLFTAAYKTASEDAKYAERNDVEFKWYTFNKALSVTSGLTLDRFKNAQEARAYIYKAYDGNIMEFIKKYRSGMVGANKTQENELSMLFKLFLGYSLDEIKE